MIHLSLCSGVGASGLPKYTKLPDQALGQLEGEPTADACAVVWRSNIGAWRNGTGYGQRMRAAFALDEDDGGRPRLRVTLTATSHQAEIRREVSPVLETRWRATAEEADSAFTTDVAGRSVTLVTPDGTRVTDALGAGLPLREGLGFRAKHDAAARYLSVAAYLRPVAETAQGRGTTICTRTITFEPAR
jgi:hypothetical protein